MCKLYYNMVSKNKQLFVNYEFKNNVLNKEFKNSNNDYIKKKPK